MPLVGALLHPPHLRDESLLAVRSGRGVARVVRHLLLPAASDGALLARAATHPTGQRLPTR